MLLAVFFSLVFLTVLTLVMSVLTDALQLQQWELWISMGIATVKAMLVIFFFHACIAGQGLQPIDVLFVLSIRRFVHRADFAGYLSVSRGRDVVSQIGAANSPSRRSIVLRV